MLTNDGSELFLASNVTVKPPYTVTTFNKAMRVID
jgi:hypothetical protein